MAVTAGEIAREKDRLPRGWGRFGKALEQLTQDTSEIRFRGAAKQEVPGFLDAVEANAR